MADHQGTSPAVPVSLLVTATAYLLPTMVLAVWRQNNEFILYSVVMVLLIGAVYAVHQQCRLSGPVLWGLNGWGAAHMLGGLVSIPESWPHEGKQAVVYSLWLIPNLIKYDHLVHFFGFAVTTFVCWHGLKALVRKGQPSASLCPTLGVLVLCVAGSLGFGALNEIIEFAATRTLPETNIGGYENTGWDLVSNLAGALSAAIWLRISERKSLDVAKSPTSP